MIPPAKKKTSVVTMYKIPMRLWSTVTSHLAIRPSFHDTGYTASVLTATRACPLVDTLLQVHLECAHLHVAPVVADRGHEDAALAQQALEARLLHQDRVGGDRRPIVALALHAVALRAHADPLRLPKRLRRAGADERLV